MAIGYSRVADLNGYFNNIYEDTVFAAREGSLGPRIVRTFTDGRGDQTRTLTEYSQVSFTAVAETEDINNPTQFTKSALATLTPSEVAAQFILTDRRIETDPDNARQDAATELGLQAATKIDVDIFGNFSSLSGGTVGASGSTMTWEYFFIALTELRHANVPPPYVCVLPPRAYYYMGKAASIASSAKNAPEFQDEVMRRWWVDQVAGVDIFVSSNCPESGTDAYGAMFNPLALAFDLRRDLRIELERDASKRAWEVNATMLYAHGVWRPAWGVAILVDNQVPS